MCDGGDRRTSPAKQGLLISHVQHGKPGNFLRLVSFPLQYSSARAMIFVLTWKTWYPWFHTVLHFHIAQISILNTCHNFEFFSGLVFPEGSLCRGHLAVPGHKCKWQSKNIVYPSWPHLDARVEAFQVGVILGKLNYEVAFRPICTFPSFVMQFFKVDIWIASGFFLFFWKHTLVIT